MGTQETCVWWRVGNVVDKVEYARSLVWCDDWETWNLRSNYSQRITSWPGTRTSNFKKKSPLKQRGAKKGIFGGFSSIGTSNRKKGTNSYRRASGEQEAPSNQFAASQ